MTSDDIKKFKALMLRMRKEDPDFRFSNSRLHQYRMGPTLSEAELRAFEQKNQVTLPADYRLFLKEAWNGGGDHSPNHTAKNSGAGPGCGLRTFDWTAHDRALSKPFPFTEAAKIQQSDLKDDWEDDEHSDGFLSICYQSGAQFSILIVNGPAYGTVWDLHLDFSPEDEFVPTDLNFGGWFQQWIDRIIHKAIPVLANERIAASVELGMTKAQVIEICGGRWKEDNGASPSFIRTLQFEHLATRFVLDSNDIVTRIIDHSIYETGKYKTWNLQPSPFTPDRNKTRRQAPLRRRYT